MRAGARAGARVVGAALAAVAALLVVAGPAAAHVEPDPESVAAGQRATVGFRPEHGCDGSPIVRMRITIPPGATDPAPGALAGWQGRIEGAEVVFEGGSMPSDATEAFPVSFTVAAGVASGELVFPTVQECAQGVERWVELTAPGAAEPDFPAPVVQVTGAAASSSTTPTTEGRPTTAPTATPTTGAASGDDGGDDDGDGTALVIVGVLAAVLAVGGGLYAWRRRGEA